MNKCFAGGHLRYVDGAWRDDNGYTVDIEPVRHGEWKEWWPGSCALILTGEEMLWECSECEAKYSDIEGMRYCPNCGAKMDGDME